MVHFLYCVFVSKTLCFCSASERVPPDGHRGGVQKSIENTRFWNRNPSTDIASPKLWKTQGFRRHPWATRSRPPGTQPKENRFPNPQLPTNSKICLFIFCSSERGARGARVAYWVPGRAGVWGGARCSSGGGAPGKKPNATQRLPLLVATLCCYTVLFPCVNMLSCKETLRGS